MRPIDILDFNPKEHELSIKQRARFYKALAYRKLCNDIDQRHLAVLRRLGASHYRILNLLTRVEDSITLANRGKGKGLVFCMILGSLNSFLRLPVLRPLRSVRRLLRRLPSDIDLLRYVNFPAQKCVQKILMKVDTRSVGIQGLIILQRALLSNEVIQKLLLVPRINMAVIKVAQSDHIHHIDHRFLKELSEMSFGSRGSGIRRRHNQLDHIGRMLNDCNRMAIELGRDFKVSNVDALRKKHDQFVFLQFNTPNARDMDINFGPPPIPGSKNFRYIPDVRQLTAMARRQGLCISSKHYVHRLGCEVAHRRLWAFEIACEEGGACTLHYRNGKIVLHDHAGYRNRKLSKQTCFELSAWLRDGQKHFKTSKFPYLKKTARMKPEDCALLFDEDDIPF